MTARVRVRRIYDDPEEADGVRVLVDRLWGVTSASPLTAASAVALTLVLVAKARWEEQRLRAHFPDYDAYAARTPRFVPGAKRALPGGPRRRRPA